MKCRSCGAEIAANALICYKCGTATQEPRITPPPARRPRSRSFLPGLVLLGLALAAGAAEYSGCLNLL
jgi:hypothetical protein